VTLADLLVALRQRLVDVLAQNDRDTLQQLCIVFGTMREASYTGPNRALSAILTDLEYSAQHGAMGVMGKTQDIPSVDAIRAALVSAA
jgi:hypothetical protein